LLDEALLPQPLGELGPKGGANQGGAMLPARQLPDLGARGRTRRTYNRRLSTDAGSCRQTRNWLDRRTEKESQERDSQRRKENTQWDRPQVAYDKFLIGLNCHGQPGPLPNPESRK